MQLIQQLGSREAITRRFFLIFEYEELRVPAEAMRKREAIASLQTRRPNSGQLPAAMWEHGGYAGE